MKTAAVSAVNKGKTLNHPCFNCGASQNARIHLPVAPRCNIQCNYCVRKFDCINESRPGVVSAVLRPHEAAGRYEEVKKTMPNLTVAGIAGPGDALANFEEVRETLLRIRKLDPGVTFCLSTNGLLLPQYADDLISLGVSHLTVTVNAVNAQTGAKIYDIVSFMGKTYKGEAAAAILLQNQLTGIRCMADRGIVVKVNTVLLKGINENEIPEIMETAAECGCAIANIMQLIPVRGSKFEYMELVSNFDLNRIRKECAGILPQMYHCRQCRADAVGTLGNDVSHKFACGDRETRQETPVSNERRRFAVCSKDGHLINQHFGHAEQFFIYDYIDGKAVFVETRLVEKYCTGPDQDEEDQKILQMVKTIDDCDAVVCLRIGAYPSGVLKEKGIRVVTTYNRIEEALSEAAAGLSGESTSAAAECLFLGLGGKLMKKTFTIADQTLNRALSLGLAPADIKRIADTLQKYPVSCFDIDASTIRNYPFSYELPHSMIRYTVGLADAMPETDGNRKIRINWDHQREKGLRALGKMAQAAKSSELYLGLGNIRELGLVGFLRYMDWARKYNVHGIIYRCDGTEDVFDLTDKLLQIKRLAPCPIEFETSNTLGLAAAQSLAAIKAGACRVSASVAGMFDYSATEQVLMSAKHLWQYEIPQGKELAADFQMILSLFGIKTPANKVMIGRNVFAHESGIHVDGIIKNPSIYEVIRPEDVGLKRKLVIGKHSGTASIKSKMIQLGFQISDDEVKCLLESVRELAQFQKGPLTDQQLKDLFLKKSGGNSNGKAI